MTIGPAKPLAGVPPVAFDADAKDAAGHAMWFNGQPSLAPNFPGLSPQGGKVIDGSKVVSSGLALDGPQKPWKVRFTKAGTYRLSSVFHPAKELRVTVKQNRKGVPTAAQDRKTVKVGDMVKFEMSKDSIELHNIAFAPKPYLDAMPFLGPVLSPFVVYRSEASSSAPSTRRRCG